MKTEHNVKEDITLDEVERVRTEYNDFVGDISELYFVKNSNNKITMIID